MNQLHSIKYHDGNITVVDHVGNITRVVKERGEFDGVCHVIFFSGQFNGVLPNPETDLIGAYVSEENNLSFSAHSRNDDSVTMLSFEELPKNVQEMVAKYIKEQDFEEIGVMDVFPNGKVHIEGDNTENGYVYKSKRGYALNKGICYVDEYGLRDYEEYIENGGKTLTEKGLLRLARKNNWGFYTRKDFENEIREQFKDLGIKVSADVIKSRAAILFDMVDWQTPSALANELREDEEFYTNNDL